MLTEPLACNLYTYYLLVHETPPDAVACSSVELLTLKFGHLSLLAVVCSPVKALLQGESHVIGLHNIVPTFTQEAIVLRELTGCTNTGIAALLHTYVYLL